MIQQPSNKFLVTNLNFFVLIKKFCLLIRVKDTLHGITAHSYWMLQHIKLRGDSFLFFLSTYRLFKQGIDIDLTENILFYLSLYSIELICLLITKRSATVQRGVRSSRVLKGKKFLKSIKNYFC
jgi:hypothetical protein